MKGVWTLKKFKLFLDIQKEEDWLNGMAKRGWLCKHVNSMGIYHFEKTAASDQIIRIDYQTFKTKEAKNRYIQLYEDYGWEHLGTSWLHYWRKPANGMDELFSDRSSQKAYYRRLLEYYGFSGFALLFLTIILFNNSTQYTSLKEAYFTPGLWDKEGGQFLFAFLFETPFALLRFGSPWLLLIWAVVLLIMYLKYQKKSVKKMKLDKLY